MSATPPSSPNPSPGDSGQPSPAWDHLPHDPQSFFELAEDFGRKDLKRAYNRLLRAFKPETHPAEFQRIRAAYETLDRQLRYGGTIETLGDATRSSRPAEFMPTENQGQPIESTEPQRQQQAEPRADHAIPIELPAKAPLDQRVQTESPAELYQEIQQQAKKSPYDYYALAVLSDVCDRRDGLQFARWLLEGIKTHPQEYALQRLLQAYLAGPLVATTEAAGKESAILTKLLVASAGAIGSDTFYPITEPAWDKLLRTESLDTFVATLRKCEAKLRDIGIAGKMAFTIRALRTAMWKLRGASPDSQAWATESMEFVDSNFEQIPYELEFEVDLLGLVHQYQQIRKKFVRHNPLRKDMDAALQAYFTSDQIEGDRQMIAQQTALAADAATLLQAFPASQENGPAVELFYPVWGWASEEVADRVGVREEEDFDLEMWSRRCHALLTQLEAKSDGSWRGQLWNWSGLVLQAARVLIYCLLWALIAIPIFMLCFSQFESESEFAVLIVLFGAGMGVIGSFFGGRWLARQLVERIYHPYCRRMGLRCYQKLWRRDALDMLSRSRLPFTLFRDLLHHQASERISTSLWVSGHVANDYALAIYALALRHIV